MADLHNRGSPRLQFTNEERASRALEKPIARAEKAADKAEAARKKLRNKHRLKLSVEEVTADRRATAAESSAGEAAAGMPDASDEGILDVRTDPAAPGVKNTRQRRPSGKPENPAGAPMKRQKWPIPETSTQWKCIQIWDLSLDRR